MYRSIIILFLLAGLLSGCIKEDMDNCEAKLRLSFRYTYNNQRQNLLASQVGDIRVYLFDQKTGVLTDIIRADRQDIDRGWLEPDIPEGVYTAVAWGTSGEDMMQGGYQDAEMTNPATHTYSPQVRIGVTTLDTFRMMLVSNPLSAGSTGEVTPVRINFDHLFFAIAKDMSVTKENNRTVEFDFIKNTSTLKVRITGLQYLSAQASATDQPLYVFATGPNERYLYDNRIDPNTREVHYEPPYTTLTATTMDVDIRIQRLDIAYHSIHPVLFYIQSKTTGQDMIIPLDVTDAILRAEDAQGNPIWQTQEDVDREDEFPFEISILHDLSVRVTVNGFEIVDVNPGVDRN